MARQRQSTRSRETGRPQGVVFSRFDGIVNTVARNKLKPTQLHAAVNIDLNRDGFPTSRVGRTATIAATKPHSLFSDGTTFLCVQAGDLKTVDPVNKTLAVLRRNVGNNFMSCVSADNLIAYSNEVVIGYIINGTDYSFDAPTREYKHAPIPGQLLGYYKGSLHICRGSQVYFTEPFLFNEIDERFNFMDLDSRITMYAPVDDGIWVSTQNAIYYLSGDEPHIMQYRVVSREPNKSGIVTYVDSRLFGGRKEDPAYGKIIVFPTTAGLCWATNGGLFGNITGRKYTLPDHVQGAAIFRQGDINQAIFAVR